MGAEALRATQDQSLHSEPSVIERIVGLRLCTPGSWPSNVPTRRAQCSSPHFGPVANIAVCSSMPGVDYTIAALCIHSAHAGRNSKWCAGDIVWLHNRSHRSTSSSSNDDVDDWRSEPLAPLSVSPRATRSDHRHKIDDGADHPNTGAAHLGA
jgi:hypothetical protein